MTTFEQAWRDAYGTPEAWERERHGTADAAQSEVYGTPQSWQSRRRDRRRFGAGRGSDTKGGGCPEVPLRHPLRDIVPPADIFEQELADTLEAVRLTRERRAGA